MFVPNAECHQWGTTAAITGPPQPKQPVQPVQRGTMSLETMREKRPVRALIPTLGRGFGCPMSSIQFSQQHRNSHLFLRHYFNDDDVVKRFNVVPFSLRLQGRC